MAATEPITATSPKHRKRDLFKTLLRARNSAGGHRRTSSVDYYERLEDAATQPVSVEELNRVADVVAAGALTAAETSYTRLSGQGLAQAQLHSAEVQQDLPTTASAPSAAQLAALEGISSLGFTKPAGSTDALQQSNDTNDTSLIDTEQHFVERRGSLSHLRGLRISHSRKQTLDLDSGQIPAHRSQVEATLHAAAAELVRQTAYSQPNATAAQSSQVSPALLQAMVVRQQRLLSEKDSQITELQTYVEDLREKLGTLLQETYYWQRQLEQTKIKEAAAAARAAQLERAQAEAQHSLDSDVAERVAQAPAAPAAPPLTAAQAEEMAEELAAEAIEAIRQDADLVLKEVAVMVGCAYWKQRYQSTTDGTKQTAELSSQPRTLDSKLSDTASDAGSARVTDAAQT